MLDRPAHLLHTAALLDDPQSDITRMAIGTLSRAGWEPAVPALVALLDHTRPTVRAEVAEGLLRMGGSAVSALCHAAGHARPDRRSRYTDVLDRFTGDGRSDRLTEDGRSDRLTEDGRSDRLTEDGRKRPALQ
ncbi:MULTISPECIES: HEAT repeat domain-containing protein [unclassified Streptomyces]|uniref:HEAT repeat domain-containing protein n=1 Tax=unclassified Streptomyces TaxID=2593676 RepID=UPI0035DBA272